MLAYVHQLGGNVVSITPLNGVDPGFGGGMPPTDPGYGRPGGARPGHDLPHLPGIPSHDLPHTPPPHVPMGTVLVLVRDPAGVWHYAALPPGTPTPDPLPVPPPTAAPKG